SPEAWLFFDERFTYGLLPDSHIIAYPIPIIGDRLELAGRQVNFQWYWNIPEGPELDEMMTGRDGLRRPVSVHADDVQEHLVEELHRRARREIAVRPLVELITAVERPFVTVIADAATPRLVVGRICLIGDAGVTCRPHAGAGGAKAAADAWALAESLVEAGGDVDRALQVWEARQLEQGYALLAKVRHMGRVLQGGGRFAPGDPVFRWGLPAVAEPDAVLRSSPAATAPAAGTATATDRRFEVKISAQFVPGDRPVFVESVRKAEACGYARAYLVDGQLLWRNVFVYMTLGLDATERMPFGTAVTNPSTRHPSVLANAHATLAEVFPGRVILGIGRGDNSVRTLGKKQVATDRMRDVVPMLRGLMAGKAVDIE